MVNLDWLTEAEYKEAYKKAQAICAEFYADTDEGEETWSEIEIGDKVFDLNCWEEDDPQYDWEDFDTRQNPVHCTLYPVYWDDGGEGYRVTDWDNALTLFTIKEKNHVDL